MKLLEIGCVIICELPLFHNTQAMMNMVRAKTAPTIVQQQSVIFLCFSFTGSCSGKITFSSNILKLFYLLNKKFINSIKMHKILLQPTILLKLFNGSVPKMTLYLKNKF